MFKRSTVVAVLSVFLTLLTALTVNAKNLEEEFTPSFKPSMNATRTETPVRIDGELNDRAWRLAGVANHFAENSPGDQVKPPVESMALVTYDEDNLYVALIAFDNPDDVRTSYSDRDEIFRDDYFGIMLDTYGDASWAYELFVNPYGVQGDLRMESSGNENSTFDIIWESMGKVTDSGYQVEIAIPFASLRFPDRAEHTWRINFWRDHQRDIRRRYSWAAIDRDDPCFICQFGYLNGLTGIKSGKNLEIMPSVLGSQFGELSNGSDPSSPFDDSDPDFQGSVDARYRLTPNSVLEATINPDFSQVESDADQIDVNTNFGLYFSESRPFFQEGGELYNTWITAVYTRSINDPRAAAKFTGQFGRTTLAYMFAYDENSTMMLPFQQQSAVSLYGESILNIMRARRMLYGDSYLGMMFTDRRLDDFGDNGEYKGGSGTLFGLDGSFVFLGNYRIEFQALSSYTEESFAPDMIDTTYESGMAQSTFDNERHTVALDGEKFWGDGVYLSFERDARTFSFDLDYVESSPTFRSENGFVSDNDFRTIDFDAIFMFRPNREWLTSWQPVLNFGRKWHHSGEVDIFKFDRGAFDEWIRPSVYLETKAQTSVYLMYLNSQECYNGVLLPGISRGTIEIDTRATEAVGGGFNVSYGRTIYRDRTAPEMGLVTSVTTWLNLKPTERLKLSQTLWYQKMDHLDAYLEQNPSAEREIFEGYILRNRLTYQFTRQLFLRLVVQYNDFSERLNIEPLLTYKINPFTKFYVGFTGTYDNFYPCDENDLANSCWDMSSRQFFAKLQYLFRM